MLIKSASNPTTNEYFIFFIPILEKYILIIYIVVSVEPCITDAILPIKLSGPYLDNMSLNIINELDPDIGLKIANGNTSLGNPILLKKLENKLDINVIILLSVIILMAIIMVNIVGNKFIDTFIPSFTPSINVSKISIFL